MEKMYSKLEEMFEKADPVFRQEYEVHRNDLRHHEKRMLEFNQDHFFFNETPGSEEEYKLLSKEIGETRQAMIDCIRRMKKSLGQ